MPSTTTTAKGKGKATDFFEIPVATTSIPLQEDSDESSSGSSSNSSDSESGSEDSEYDSSDSEEISQEYLNSLLDKARKNARDSKATSAKDGDGEADVITLDAEPNQPTLPPLDPGPLPRPYLNLPKSRRDATSVIRPQGLDDGLSKASSQALPAPPIPPPELTKTGQPLTKKEKKALKNKTAGPDWFGLPAPPEADLPRLYREVEAMRLRNHLDPKRFYRKDEGEGKGIKGLPKHFAIGTILPSSTPFGTASSDNLTKANRKRTLVDELVDDAEAKRYAKKKFSDLQRARGAKGKNTLAAKKALRSSRF